MLPFFRRDIEQMFHVISQWLAENMKALSLLKYVQVQIVYSGKSKRPNKNIRVDVTLERKFGILVERNFLQQFLKSLCVVPVKC